jgi:hypothetical protein
MKPIRRIAALAVVLALVVPAVMLPATATAQATPEAWIEMMRSDVRTDKMIAMGETLTLTAEEGAKFWPIYRAYSQELSLIGDRRMALIKKFADEYGSVTAESATAMATAWFAMESDYTKLLKKTHATVAKDISPIVAVQFVQVENALNMLLRLQLAAELPLVE